MTEPSPQGEAAQAITAQGETAQGETAPIATLEAWLDALPKRPDWPIVRGVLTDLADALAQLHAQGRTCGRLAPGTVLVEPAAPPRARLAPSAGPQHGVAPGAPRDVWHAPWRAPELASQEAFPTPSSDMYALAAIAYRMVTGRAPPPPVPGEDRPPQIRAEHLAADDYPASFLAMVDWTLEAAPETRPDAGAWRAQALSALLAAPLAAPAARRSDDDGGGGGRRPAERPSAAGGGLRPLALLLGAGALAVVMLGTVLLVHLAGALRPGAPQAPPASVASPPPGEVAGGAAAPAMIPAPVPATIPAPADASATARRLVSPFRDCSTCPEMVVVPAATARIRLVPPQGSEHRLLDVTLPKPFAIGRFELTRGEFRAFALETGFKPEPGCYSRNPEWRLDSALSWAEPGFPQDDRHPAACLNLDDAKAYAAWLSQRTGKAYRLPTDPEWHAAAAAGAPDAATPQCAYANGADETVLAAEPTWVTAACRDGYRHTAPVGSLAPTGPGLSDLFGNLWEWVDSCVPDFSAPTPAFGSCPADAPHILRGGSWSDPPARIGLDPRSVSPPAVRDQIVGARLLRELTACEAGDPASGCW